MDSDVQAKTTSPSHARKASFVTASRQSASARVRVSSICASPMRVLVFRSVSMLYVRFVRMGVSRRACPLAARSSSPARLSSRSRIDA
eukprot:421459-Pleurochrysis_carterae.AAC.2